MAAWQSFHYINGPNWQIATAQKRFSFSLKFIMRLAMTHTMGVYSKQTNMDDFYFSNSPHRRWFTQPPDGRKFDLKKDDEGVAEKQNFS